MERPGVHRLAAFLLNRRERDDVAAGDEVRLLGEFPLRRGEEIGAAFGDAFWNGPSSVVFPCPEWPTRMREQDFQGIPATERQETGADLGPAAHLCNLPLKLRPSTACLF